MKKKNEIQVIFLESNDIMKKLFNIKTSIWIFLPFVISETVRSGKFDSEKGRKSGMLFVYLTLGLFEWCPWIRVIGVGNTAEWWNASKNLFHDVKIFSHKPIC